MVFNPLNAELNPICHLLAILGGATIVVVSRLRVKVNNTEHLVSSKVCMIKMVMLIVLSVHNETNTFNSGVLAYNLNSLMMVMATPKPVGIWTDCVRTLR